MKKKISSKKCIAIVLALVMVITSLPFMFVSALTTGAYDPAPYWGDAGDKHGAINTNFMATLNTDGSVSISFPNANAQKTYDGSADKTITQYVFTLTKLSEDGSRKEIYSEAFDASAVATGDTSAKYPNNIYYGPGGLASLPDYDVQSTYDVAIMAIDSDGWFSDKIHTLLSDTPYYSISADFSPEELWIARTLLGFGAAGDADINGKSPSSSGDSGGLESTKATNTEIDFIYSSSDINADGATDINADGQFAEMGYKNDSEDYAYRFWIPENTSGNNAYYRFDTTWSRQHYDFEVADSENAEAWFYVDFTDTDFSKVAFNLRANEYYYVFWRDGKTDDTKSRYGTLFSTKAIEGIANEGSLPGVYIQNEDGLWEETEMVDGYATNLQNYKGFVRVPLDYFVIQEDQYITSNNTFASWKDGKISSSDFDNHVNGHLFLQSSYTNGISLVREDGTTATGEKATLTFKQRDENSDDAWTYPQKDVYKIVVNPKGTSINDAYIVYERYSKATIDGTWVGSTHLWGGSEATRDLGYCLHPSTQVTTSGNTMTITDGKRATSDIVSAGFEVVGWSESSEKKSFYLDQVMVCQKVAESSQSGIIYDTDESSATYGMVSSTSTVKFAEETAFAGDYGYVVKSYYDRTVEVPKIIAGYITDYVGEIPSLEDVNALEMINSIIETYINCFPGCSTVDDAIAYLNTAGHTEAYNRYTAAVTFIENYINLGDSARNYNAVVAFESGVELLPDPEFADYNDEELKTQLEELMALYKSFNLSHFEILGAEAEDKFTELYSIMMGEEVKTGYSIGAYPYIPFNDFETNYTYGQNSLKYYDDYPLRASKDTKNQDVNNTKNFVTYTTSEHVRQLSATGKGNGAIGWSVNSYNPANDQVFENKNYFNRMDAIINNNGFDGSLGAQINLNGDIGVYFDSEGAVSEQKFATLSTTYMGDEADSWSGLSGIDLSALSATVADAGEMPNCFVMYIDYTKVTDLSMNIKFIAEDSTTGNDVIFYFCGGLASENPAVYQLDSNGEWEEVLLEKTALDASKVWMESDDESGLGLCSIAPSSLNNLQGYKGFIAIPFSYFRKPIKQTTLGVTVTTGAETLDQVLSGSTTYKLKQAKISFWDYTGENIDTSVVVDAMGFTYDPSNATDASAVENELISDNSTTITEVKNMDEYFGVKTNDSVTVEKMIAEIDPYVGEDQFIADCNAVLEAYANLSSYQKSLEEIDYAYNTLFYKKYEKLYMGYNTVINQEPWVAKYATATELLTDIGALDSTATSFDITDTDNALTVPYNTTTGVIDYDTLGIADKAEAEAIVEMYEKGYMRLSGAEKANLSEDDLTKLENAYNAAKRLLLLEDYLVDINTFESEIIQIYTSGTAEPDAYMVSYENPVLLQALTDYENMSVFAKKMISETVDTANINYANMYVSAEAVYDNSHTITMSNDTTIDGGILVFENRMNTCAIDVGDKIDINTRTVLDAATLNEIEYCLGQTESFLPRYAHVDEINVAYHALADLLPVADIASVDSSDSELNTINITNETDGTSYTAYIDLSYIATRLNKNVDLYAQSTLKWTQTSGTAYDAFEDYMYNGVNAAGLADYQNADGVVTALVGSYTNGDSSSIEKYAYEISVDATEAANVPTGAVYSGKIEFYVVDPAVVAEKTADGTDISEVLADSANFLDVVTVDVVFESTNGADPMTYTVEIPAIVQVDWDDDSVQDVSYSVEANLGSNELSVGVAGDGTNTLVAENTDQTLTYTETNFKITTFTGTVAAGTKPADEPSITVTGWDAVAVGEYSTQLTYTVDVTSN